MMHLLVQLILVEKADHYGIRFCGSRKNTCEVKPWHDPCTPGQNYSLGASDCVSHRAWHWLHIHVLRHLRHQRLLHSDVYPDRAKLYSGGCLAKYCPADTAQPGWLCRRCSDLDRG